MRNGSLVAAVLAISLLGSLSGCALYHPYVTTSGAPDLCPTETGGDGLKQACRLRKEVNSARKQHAVAQNWTSTGLIALSGVVGYRTARDLSSASTTAMAGAGLAGYALSQAINPVSRQEIYQKGYAALNCSLEIYWREVAALQTQSSSFSAVRISKQLLDEKIASARKTQGSSAENFLTVLSVEAETLERQVNARVTGTLDAELRAAALRIERELGDAIRSSLLPISKLAPQVESFIVAPGGQEQGQKAASRFLDSGGAEALLKGRAYSVAGDSLAAFIAYANLESAAGAFLSETSQVRSTPDFSSCAVGVVQAAEPKIEAPFMLGVDNADQGQTKELKSGGQLTLQLVGGRAPFDPKVAASTEELKVSVLSVGATYALVVETTATTKKGATYQVLVSDAAGSLRKFFVKVTD